MCELLEGGEVGFRFDVEGMFLCRVRHVKIVECVEMRTSYFLLVVYFKA